MQLLPMPPDVHLLQREFLLPAAWSILEHRLWFPMLAQALTFRLQVIFPKPQEEVHHSRDELIRTETNHLFLEGLFLKISRLQAWPD